MHEASTCEGIVAVGDRLVAVDGRELKGRKFAAVIKVQPTHTLKVMRPSAEGSRVEKLASDSAAKGGAGRTWTGPRHAFRFLGRPKPNQFAIGGNVEAWFGPTNAA